MQIYVALRIGIINYRMPYNYHLATSAPVHLIVPKRQHRGDHLRWSVRIAGARVACIIDIDWVSGFTRFLLSHHSGVSRASQYFANSCTASRLLETIIEVSEDRKNMGENMRTRSGGRRNVYRLRLDNLLNRREKRKELF